MHLLRKLIFVLGFAALTAAQQAFALGLGESELHSALNQPLRADIRLNNLRDLEESDIIIRLASNDDFERAGVERLEFYNELEFEVMLDNESGPLVRVTTQEPVREPYLSFLVEARWSTGRLLREYTFLLDLPVYDDNRRSQPVEAAGAEQRRTTSPGAQSQQQSRPQPQRQPSSEPERRQTSGSSTYGPVSESDTLWEIALQARPGRDLSVQQTMLAIQRKNPEAFINGNINLLRSGQVLRLPSRDEIQNFSQRDAVSEVASHNREWSERTMGAQLDAGQRERTAPREASEPSGQVRLAAPSQAGAGESGQGAGTGETGGTELTAELAAAQEELDKSQRENRELSSRVEELEAQIETMESLVEASNEQLRALQISAEQSRQAEAEAQDPGEGTEGAVVPGDEETTDALPDDEDVTETEASAAETDSQEQTESEATAQAEQEAAEARIAEERAAQQAVEEEAERGRRVIRSVPQSKSIMDHVMDNLLWIALGVLAILIAVYAVVRRRNADADEEDEGDLEAFEPEFEPEDFTDSQDEFDSSEDADDEGVDLSREPDDHDDMGQWQDEEETSVEAETGDVVGEADIYIAYGKLDQAEELLLNGLEKEPGSPAILSKLLEVYAENRDVAAFDRYYTNLLATGDRPAIQRAGELRDMIPGAGEFDVNAGDPSTTDMGSDEFASFNLGDDPESDNNANADDLDFKLDFDEESESTGDTSNEMDLDDDFTFDLDDDDTESSLPEPAPQEGDLESSSNRYDLSFDEQAEDDEFSEGLRTEGSTSAEDDFTLDFDLDEELPTEQQPEPEALKLEGENDEFPELDLKLDEEEGSYQEAPKDLSNQETEDDWSFDFESGDTEPSDLDKLDDELSILDEPVDEEEPSASYEEPSAQEPSALNEMPSAEEPEFNLDDMNMDDMDLSSLDDEMSDLDADSDSSDRGSFDRNSSESSSEVEPTPAPLGEDDDMFEEALSGFDEEPEAEAPAPRSEAQDISEEDMDAELDFLADTDEAATKLDLARAYIDMGDADGARDILEEVSQEGNDEQKQEAAELMGRIES